MLDLFFSCSTLEEPQHLQFYAQKPSNGLEGTRNADEDENMQTRLNRNFSIISRLTKIKTILITTWRHDLCNLVQNLDFEVQVHFSLSPTILQRASRGKGSPKHVQHATCKRSLLLSQFPREIKVCES